MAERDSLLADRFVNPPPLAFFMHVCVRCLGSFDFMEARERERRWLT